MCSDTHAVSAFETDQHRSVTKQIKNNIRRDRRTRCTRKVSFGFADRDRIRRSDQKGRLHTR